MGMAFNGFQMPQAWNAPLPVGHAGPLAAPSLSAPIPAMKPGFNDVGGTNDKIRGLAASLMAAGGNQEGSQDILRALQERQKMQSEDEYRRQQLAVQSMVANQRADTEPASIKALRAAGIDPQSPYGQQLIASNLNRPIVVGSSESGFVPIGGSFGMPGSPGLTDAPGGAGVPAIDPRAIARLKANPSEAILFDQQFGQGSAARVLGGQ